MDEALPTTWQVKFIDKKEFAKVALDEDVKAFVVHMSFLSLEPMIMYRAWEAQIALLLTEKVTIPDKYLDFMDVFSKKSAAKLSKRSDLNEHSIN